MRIIHRKSIDQDGNWGQAATLQDIRVNARERILAKSKPTWRLKSRLNLNHEVFLRLIGDPKGCLILPTQDRLLAEENLPFQRPAGGHSEHNVGDRGSRRADFSSLQPAPDAAPILGPTLSLVAQLDLIPGNGDLNRIRQLLMGKLNGAKPGPGRMVAQKNTQWFSRALKVERKAAAAVQARFLAETIEDTLEFGHELELLEPKQ